mmetsp:Transcript_1313/g.3219  ORF Transcript_1313/g.3219 Transcript_1313/m.3219 type:complete len:89 (+) Transcript_1313:642-908(+)
MNTTRRKTKEEAMKVHGPRTSPLTGLTKKEEARRHCRLLGDQDTTCTTTVRYCSVRHIAIVHAGGRKGSTVDGVDNEDKKEGRMDAWR